ncbi:MAG: ABC transporter substrate-binding protein [Myxococcales bacterium]|nr:MAG: ABC transporter substrate-binding protein [Myxococcales bacterium]
MSFRTPALLALALSLLLGVALLACKSANGSQERAGERSEEPSLLRYMSAPGTVSPIELAEDLGYLAPYRLDYVSSTTSGPQSIQAVVTGDVDVGSAFNGAILKLIAAGAPIRAVVGSYGVDPKIWGGYYVKQDSPIKSARDLIGKKVAVNTVGAHQEFALKEYLVRSGFSQEDIKQVMLVSLPPINVEQALRQGQTDVSVLTSIYRDRALERGGLRLLFSDLELFGSFTAGSYVLRRDFIARHPRAARTFVEGVGKALDWSRETPRDQVLERFRSIIAKRKRNEDATVIKYWHSYGVGTPQGRIQPRDFGIWIDWMVRAGELRQGQLNLPAVYTNDLNQPQAK